VAAGIRERDLKPALDQGQKIRLDFRGVEGATQSFVHAMVSELIRKSGADVLDRIEFSSCNPTVRSVVEIVVEYSQLGEEEAGTGRAAEQADAPAGGRARVAKNRRPARARRR
jgi:hypothetical protein